MEDCITASTAASIYIRVTRSVNRRYSISRTQLTFFKDEKDRLDCYHGLIRLARQRVNFQGRCMVGQPELHLVNVPWGEARPRILDLGCGTGIWVLEMAQYVSHIVFERR